MVRANVKLLGLEEIAKVLDRFVNRGQFAIVRVVVDLGLAEFTGKNAKGFHVPSRSCSRDASMAKSDASVTTRVSASVEG